MKGSEFSFHPLTSERWKDFEELFGERGACGGCWCMNWLLSRKDFDVNKGDGNKKKMKKLVANKIEPGIIAYFNNKPAGWCAVQPREKYIRLENSKVLRRIDDQPVWSVTCFFIKKDFRCKGLSTEILKEVINYCRKKGAKIIEGYPVEPYSDKMPPAFAWTGFPTAFIKAGFTEAERRGRTRPIMRYYL